MKTYSEKLKDPRWQRKRLEILERDNFTCQYCDSKENTLHVHHKLYLKGKSPWEYNDKIYVTLCDDCHVEAEDNKNYILELLGNNRKADLSVCYLLKALLGNDENYYHWKEAIEKMAKAINSQYHSNKDNWERSVIEMGQFSMASISSICKATDYWEESMQSWPTEIMPELGDPESALDKIIRTAPEK